MGRTLDHDSLVGNHGNNALTDSADFGHVRSGCRDASCVAEWNPSVRLVGAGGRASQAGIVYLLAAPVGGFISAFLAFSLGWGLPWMLLAYSCGGVLAVFLIAVILSFRTETKRLSRQMDLKSWRRGYSDEAVQPLMTRSSPMEYSQQAIISSDDPKMSSSSTPDLDRLVS